MANDQARLLPVRRYLAALPVAALAFMGLAIADQRETLLPVLGLSTPTAPPVPSAEARAGADAAIAAVREFDLAVESAHRDGDVERLRPLAAPPVVEELAAAIAFARAAREPPPRLSASSVVSVEPAPPGGHSVLTDETWIGARSSRLRFRYRVGVEGGRARVEEHSPVLPEPQRETAR